jgi:ssDNA-binding replication factor A large subunit
MKIRELRAGMRGLEIAAEVVDKSESTLKGGKKHAIATIRDETGITKLNLWRNQVEQVEVGDTIRVQQAFVRSWAGTLELSTWADIVVVSRSSADD